MKPIGIMRSAQVEAYQAGRQPDALGLPGIIELESGQNFEQALQDLESCTHLWIIFGFHHNTNWKPLVQTPRSNRKIGVFATRAPYRPNPIGLSLVELVSVDGLKIHIGANDILNDSPIYDIKPYHPEYDKIEEAHIGWLDESGLEAFKISISPMAEAQIEFLELHGQRELRSFVFRQLEFDPINSDKKRVSESEHYHTLAYRTWRVDFSYSENQIGILAIRSGYTEDELRDFADPYSDKKIHRLFKKEFEYFF